MAQFLGTEEGEFDPCFLDARLNKDNRICSGKNLVDSTLFIAIVTLLAVVNVSEPRDQRGKAYKPTYEQSDGIIRCECFPFVMHGLDQLSPIAI